ncbi:MAG: hypothetical protein Kow00108_05290 [Calditrichia bacterium]
MTKNNIELHWQYDKKDCLFHAEKIRSIIVEILNQLQLEFDHLAFIFVDDDYLRQLHKKYLNDDSLTDVITFDLRDEESNEGEIYVSVDRAEAVARELSIEHETEILRYIIHGILHLGGYDDKTTEERTVMKREENKLVDRYKNMLE